MGLQLLRSRSGSSYVVVLVLISVLSTFALAFVMQTGMRVSAGADRTRDAQAAYLAEAAVHHATWRLLHEPGFPADETVYEMHSLGAGRYGYKVRAPTSTTLAAIATVGIVGESLVRQSWGQHVLSRITTVYGQSTGQLPPYRRLVGATWDAPGTTVDVGSAEVTYAELAGHPRADELVMATMDANDALNVAVWDGESWGNRFQLATARKEYKCFDVAYESSSGDALVVTWSGTQGQLRYTVWNGNAWAVPAAVSTGESAEITLVRMASHPKTDEILVLVAHGNHALRVFRWDGLVLGPLGQIETNATHTVSFVADVAYEQVAGHALLVWGRDARPECGYSVWDGVALSAPGLLSSFGKKTQLVRLVAAPGSDRIVLAAVADDKDLNVSTWDGTAWVDTAELDLDVEQPAATDYPNFDVAWNGGGDEALVCWAQNASNLVRFVRCPRDSAFADCPVETGPDFGDEIRALRLFPVDGTRDVVVLGSTRAAELRYSLWTGNRFAADPARVLSTTLSQTIRLPFALARARG